MNTTSKNDDPLLGAGGYVQGYTISFNLGVNADGHFTFSVGPQIGAGVAAAGGVSATWDDGFLPSFGSTTQVGVGTVTGLPGPSAVALYDFQTKHVTVSVGAGIADYTEAGGWVEFSSVSEFKEWANHNLPPATRDMLVRGIENIEANPPAQIPAVALPPNSIEIFFSGPKFFTSSSKTPSLESNGFLDKAKDLLTAPFHALGEFFNNTDRDGLDANGHPNNDGYARDGNGNPVRDGSGNPVRTGTYDERYKDYYDSKGNDGRGTSYSGGSHSSIGRDNHGEETDRSRPVILDLDGDDVEVNINRLLSFDIDGDGYKEQTSWVSADDGFLVVDFNADGTLSGSGDGKITQAKEIVLPKILGRSDITDLQALAIMEKSSKYGGNNDGVLNSKDKLWQQLKVWQDKDQDGEVDAGEMKTLSQVGIKQINLKYDDKTGYSDTKNDLTIFGNSLLGSASYTRTNGTVVKGGVGDVALSYNKQGWRTVDTALGYEIQFEGGGKLAIAELAGKKSANLNLDTEALDGAVGDSRNNGLYAYKHSRSVQISGGNGNDDINGSENDDLLSGDAGADQIRGMGGNDLIFFDAADLVAGKRVEGNGGIDTAYVTGTAGVSLNLVDHTFEQAFGSSGNDRLDGTQSTDDLPLFGGAGNDTVIGGNGDDHLSGDLGNDVVLANNGDDRLSGNDGTDSLYGGAGSDVLSGGNHNDSLDGGWGDDLLLGGAGADSLNGSEDDDRIDGDEGNDTLDGGDGDDVLTGGVGDDQMIFWRGDDTLTGDAGNDTFVMQRGAISAGFWGWTILQGGQGSDTLILPFNKADWWQQKVAGTTNQWTFYNSQSGGGQVMVISVQDVEKIQFADKTTLTLSTNTSLDTSDSYKRAGHNAYDGDSITRPSESFTSSDGAFNGFMGNDQLNATFDKKVQTSTGSSGWDSKTYYDTAREDFIRGMSGQDSIIAGAGNDKALGEFGSDAINGGKGSDTIYGGSGSDQIWGDANNDIIYGDAGADILIGGTGNDSIDGEDGSDVITGDAGNDTIIGGSGSDLLTGGADEDLLRGGIGADRINGDDGNDNLNGEAGADVLSGGTGNDTLSGGDGFNILGGDDGNDSLLGGNDYDLIAGGNGNDTLRGGNESDTLIGGAGADLLDGDAGILDLVAYEKSSARVVIDLEVISGATTIQSASGGDAQGDTLSGIEQVIGSDHDDLIAGSSIDNVLIGGNGNDNIIGNHGHDDLIGGDGNDTLTSGNGDDRVWGDNGDDSINGSWGQDTIDGGAGADIIDYTTSATASAFNLQTNQNSGVAAGQMLYQIEHLTGTRASDNIYGTTVHNRLNGHDGDDSIYGFAGNDTLIGSNGNDRLDGGDGANFLEGGAGNDFLVAGNSDGSFGVSRLAHTGFDTETGWSVARDERKLAADVNGDGRADIVGFAVSTVAVAFGQADGTFSTAINATDEFTSTNGGWDASKYERDVADINGDGRADIVGFAQDGTYVALAKSDGTFERGKFAHTGFDTETGWSVANHERKLADVNGDGRADIVGFANSTVAVAFGQKDGTFSEMRNATDEFTRTNGGWDASKFERDVGDVNGDGRADIVGFGQLGTYAALASSDILLGGSGNDTLYGGSGADRLEGGAGSDLLRGDPDVYSRMKYAHSIYDTEAGWSVEKHERKLTDVSGDVNGDGRADIIGFADSAVVVSYGQEDGTFTGFKVVTEQFTAANGGWDASKHERDVADVDGDGRADLVGFGSNGVYVALANSNGSYSGMKSAHSLYDNEAGWSVARDERKLGDVNGDGRADIIGFTNSVVVVSYGQTDGTFTGFKVVTEQFTTTNGGWDASKHERDVADVNGDGRADLVGFADDGVYVALANSDGSFSGMKYAHSIYDTEAGWNVDINERKLADVNGDGRADVIGFAGSVVVVSYGQIDGTFSGFKVVTEQFTTANGGWSASKHERDVADVDGDGRADLVGFADNGVYVALANKGSVGIENPDTFIFNSIADSRIGAGNRDIILDFETGIDDFDLRGIDANTGLSGDQAFSFNGITAKANSVWYATEGNNLIAQGDVNGDGKADFEIEISETTSLAANDFLL